MPIKGQELLKFRCTHCSNCCTDTMVPITDADLARLVKGMGRPAHEIANFAHPRDFSPTDKDLGWLNLKEGRRLLCLKKEPMPKGSEKEDACMFFKNNRCTAYEHRPATCRVYPFNLKFDDQGKVKAIAINDAVPCPYELDGKNSVKEIKKDWDMDDEQDLAYFSKVKTWNEKKRKGTGEEFLAYLGL